MNLLKRFYINLVHHILKIWWFLTRPQSRGVKVVLIHKGSTLLVQHNYGHKLWTFPGGRVNNTEEYEAAARREMKEELRIDLDLLTKVGCYQSDYEYKKVTVECFVAEVSDIAVFPDDFEIAKAQWFPINNLPSERASSVNKIITMYETQ